MVHFCVGLRQAGHFKNVDDLQFEELKQPFGGDL
jgi:hypothetical protein